MRDFCLLLKNNFNILINRFRGKRLQKSFWSGVLTLLIGIFLIITLYCYQANSMFEGLGNYGLEDLCLFHAFLIALPVMVIIGVMRVSGKNVDNDKDLLMSLPIKRGCIIASKILNRYLYDLFFSSVLLLPFIYFYQKYTQFSLNFTLLGISVVLILPLLSVGISCVFDFILNKVFNRFKMGGLLKTILSICIYIGVMALMLTKTFLYGNVKVDTMEKFFSERFFANLFLKFLTKTDWLNSLGVILICFLPFLLGFVLYYINYGKSQSKYCAKNNNLKFSDNKSQFGVLFKKEVSSYASTPAWVINSIIGPIFVLALGVMTSFGQLDYFLDVLGGDNKIYVFAILVLAINFLNSTAIISGCSISLEGKNIWILKSSPTNENLLFFTKALLHIVILLPTTLIGMTVISIKLKVAFLEAIIGLGLTVLFVAITAFGGVLVNLIFPQLDYQDETKVIKQSMASLVNIFGGIIIAIIPLIIKLIFKFKLLKIGIISLIIYLFIFITILIILNKNGKKLYKKL